MAPRAKRNAAPRRNGEPPPNPAQAGSSLRGPEKAGAVTVTLWAGGGGPRKPAVFPSLLHLERGKVGGKAQTHVESRLGRGSDGPGESLWSLEGLQTPSGC